MEYDTHQPPSQIDSSCAAPAWKICHSTLVIRTVQSVWTKQNPAIVITRVNSYPRKKKQYVICLHPARRTHLYVFTSLQELLQYKSARAPATFVSFLHLHQSRPKTHRSYSQTIFDFDQIGSPKQQPHTHIYQTLSQTRLQNV